MQLIMGSPLFSLDPGAAEFRRRRQPRMATPTPPNNMWRAAESAAIEERRRDRNFLWHAGFFAIFVAQNTAELGC